MGPLDGGAGRIRTDDLLRAKQPLYQLSYGPRYPQLAMPALKVDEPTGYIKTFP